MSKPKAVTIVPLERMADKSYGYPYRTMDRLVRDFHSHLKDAKIALAFKLNYTGDKDGRVILGQCRKCGELDRHLHGWDFIILLNSAHWENFSEKQRAALIDHELCHAEADVDEDKEQKVDETGRLLWRVKKHDLEEFRAIVDRHGIWKQDLQEFAESIREAKEVPLFSAEEEEHKGQPAIQLQL